MAQHSQVPGEVGFFYAPRWRALALATGVSNAGATASFHSSHLAVPFDLDTPNRRSSTSSHGRKENPSMSTNCYTLIAGLGALVSVAGCEQMNEPRGAQTPAAVRTDGARDGTAPGTTHTARKPELARDATQPDNTAENAVDRSGDTQTPFDQSESSGDIKITAEIRRAIMKDDSMSINAQNSKIITDKSGVVTLRGVVNSDAEKKSIDAKANAVAGVTRVVNQLEVKTN